MATSICTECNSENNEVVDGSHCYKCGTLLSIEPVKVEHEPHVETSEAIFEGEPEEVEDDIFCSICDSQPHGVVIAIVKGDMDGLDFREHDRKYVCGECFETTTDNLEKTAEILSEFD